MWTRTGLETIFVKYPSSDILLTYLGIPGQTIQIHQERQVAKYHQLFAFNWKDKLLSSTSGAPVFPYVRTSFPSQIDIFNEQSDTIFARISNATHPSGSELFYATRQGLQGHVWTRHGPEAIFVSGPTGTAVGTYYGRTEHALGVNSPMYVDFFFCWCEVYFIFCPPAIWYVKRLAFKNKDAN